MNVYDHGTPAGDLVLLLHGLGGSADGTWGAIPSNLFDDPSLALDVAIVDYPTALRRIANVSMDLKAYADQMAEQLAELMCEYETVTLVGHSMGGLMAKAITARYGQSQGLPNELAKLRVPSIICVASPLAGAPKASYLPPPFNGDTRILVPLSDWIFENDEFFVEYARPHNTARVTEDLPLVIPIFAIAGGADPFVPIKSAFSGVPKSQRLLLAGDHSGVLKSPKTSQFIQECVLKRKDVMAQERRNFRHDQSPPTRAIAPPWVSHFISDRSHHEWEENYGKALQSFRGGHSIEEYVEGQPGPFNSLIVVLDLSDEDWRAFIDSACSVASVQGGAGNLTGVIGMNPCDGAGPDDLLREVRSRLGYGGFYTFTADTFDDVTLHMGTILKMVAMKRPSTAETDADSLVVAASRAFTMREY